MSSFRCRIGWHDWNKYGPMKQAYGGLTQFRDCKRCGRIVYAETYGNQACENQVAESVAGGASRESAELQERGE